MTARALALHAAWVFGGRSHAEPRTRVPDAARWSRVRTALGIVVVIGAFAGMVAAMAADLQGSFSTETTQRQAMVAHPRRGVVVEVVPDVGPQAASAGSLVAVSH